MANKSRTIQSSVLCFLFSVLCLLAFCAAPAFAQDDLVADTDLVAEDLDELPDVTDVTATLDEAVAAEPGDEQEAATEEVAPAEEKGAEFDWTWEAAAEEAAVDQPEADEAIEVVPAAQGASEALLAEPQWEVTETRDRTAEGSAALKDVMEENLALQEQIKALEGERDAAQGRAEALRAEVSELQRTVADAATAVSAMKKEPVPEDAAASRIADLEKQVASADRVKSEQQAEITELRRALAEIKAGQGETAVAQGSDLFRQLERENVLLRKKLVEAETAMRQAVDRTESVDEIERKLAESEAKQRELVEKLDEAKMTEKQHRQAVERLLERLPAMEEELAALRLAVAEKNAALVSREEEMRTLSTELQKREHRVEKAERMASLLEQTRTEVRRVDDKEKRDMHYNMAAVYVREGKFEDAEGEYLKALRLDPADADVHYNLGILYDDELNDKPRAALHYRRYLKLDPHGPDVDKVKGWLMKIETGG